MQFSLGFPEILSQHHWLSLSGISRIMCFGILIDMNYCIRSVPDSSHISHIAAWTDIVCAQTISSNYSASDFQSLLYYVQLVLSWHYFTWRNQNLYFQNHWKLIWIWFLVILKLCPSRLSSQSLQAMLLLYLQWHWYRWHLGKSQTMAGCIWKDI